MKNKTKQFLAACLSSIMMFSSIPVVYASEAEEAPTALAQNTVDSVTLTDLFSPYAGLSPIFTVNSDTEGVAVEGVKWYKSHPSMGAWIDMTISERFELGESYLCTISLKTDYNTQFKTNGFTATVDGEEAYIDDLTSTTVELELEFTAKEPTVIEELRLVAPTPIAGRLPDNGVSSNVRIPGTRSIDEEAYVTDVDWSYYNSTYDDWYILQEEFNAGEEYEIAITVQPAEGYIFPETKGEMNVTVNGSRDIIWPYNYDQTRAYILARDTAIQEPKFTVQPQTTMVDAETSWGWVSWGTNFAPVRLSVLSNDTVYATFFNPSVTEDSFQDSVSPKTIRAWYGSGENDYIDSNKFFVLPYEDEPETPEYNVAYWDFESETQRNAWTTKDADGDGHNWHFDRDIYDPIQNDYSLVSQSYRNGVGKLTPDNWVYSPKFTVPAAGKTTLTYLVCGGDEDYTKEHYSVYVIAGTTETKIHEETLPEHRDEKNPVECTLDLTSFAGKEIQIAFRHHDVSDQYTILVDCVGVKNVGSAYVKGDIDGNGAVDIADALVLFMYSMIPESYPISYAGNIDFTHDGNIDISDALHLFMYSMMPDFYPI